MNIIRKYLYGWDEIEPIILGCVANHMHIMTMGKHGIGKSTFADFVATALSDKDNKKAKTVVYHMQNEDMLSMVGCPMPEALARGKFEFAIHDRSILDTEVAVFDEVTRAPRETENMVLSILEERRVFGKKLPLKLVIGTCNDATYKGAMKLDAAHMDRYVAMIPIPDMGETEARFGAVELEEMIRLNFGNRTIDHSELCEAIKDIREETKRLWADKTISDNVIEFSAKFISQVMTNMVSLNKSNSKKGDKFYMSLREATRDFPKVVMACAAYYSVVQGDSDYLRSGAWEAAKYAIGFKLLFDSEKLKGIYTNLKELLTDGSAEVAALKVKLTSGQAIKRIDLLLKHADTVRDHFDRDEKVNVVGNMLEDLKVDEIDHINALIRLHDGLEKHNVCDVCLSKTKVRLMQYAFSKSLEMTLAFDRSEDPVPAV
jgi:MoxR-like ATPase